MWTRQRVRLLPKAASLREAKRRRGERRRVRSCGHVGMKALSPKDVSA